MTAGKVGVEGLNVFEYGGVLGARVFEVECPLDCREVGVFDPHTADDQAGFGIGIGKRPLDASCIQLF